MSGNIYISSPTPPTPAPVVLNQNINLNSVLQGQVSYIGDIDVFLNDSLGNPITPTSSVLVGNDLNITANIPQPSGVLFKFPVASQTVSYITGDTGWRFQNGWYNYNPPAYPLKKAELDDTLGLNGFFTLKTPLTVGGVTSKVRFVDINGQQTFSIAGNANQVVIDKLTGLMFTRFTNTSNGSWSAIIGNALSTTLVLNSVSYSDWYLIGLNDWFSIFGWNGSNGVFTDPVSGVNLITLPTLFDRFVRLADSASVNNSLAWDIAFSTFSSGYNKSGTDTARSVYVHNATSLIS